MSAVIWSTETGTLLRVRPFDRLHLKHATHEDALVNGTVLGIDGIGFTVRWDGAPKQDGKHRRRGEKIHYRFSQADGFVLGNRPYVQDES